jgi:hypothetical protein
MMVSQPITRLLMVSPSGCPLCLPFKALSAEKTGLSCALGQLVYWFGHYFQEPNGQ